MSARQLLFAQVTLLVVLLSLIMFGLSHDYYWSILWFSACAHLLGSLWAGCFILWISKIFEIPLHPILIVGLVLGIGICWEIFEAAIGATHFPIDTVETAEDLIVDIVGGAAVAHLVRDRL